MTKQVLTKPSRATWCALAAARIMLGLVFVWAFLDKLFGLGLSTAAERAWLNGGSPTTGFLNNIDGPFASMFNWLIGQSWADWLFMIGLLGIGLALVLGIGVRIATVAGSFLLVLMWLASLPLNNNPVIDDHLIYIAVLMVICFGLPQQKISLAAWWHRLPIVKTSPWLW